MECKYTPNTGCLLKNYDILKLNITFDFHFQKKVFVLSTLKFAKKRSLTSKRSEVDDRNFESHIIGCVDGPLRWRKIETF